MFKIIRCVLDKTSKGIRGVRLDNRKVLRASGPRTEHFERLYFVAYKQLLASIVEQNNYFLSSVIEMLVVCL